MLESSPRREEAGRQPDGWIMSAIISELRKLQVKVQDSMEIHLRGQGKKFRKQCVKKLI